MAEVENEPQENEAEVLAPTEEAGTEETPEGASADEQESTPDEQPEVEAPEGEEPPAESAKTPEPETEPFGFTADRRRFEVPGAALVKYNDEKGNLVEKVVIDKDAWNRFVQPHLRDGSAVHKRELEFKRQIQGLDPERNETVIRARALLGSLEGVLESEASLTAFLQNFESNKELWSLKADAAAREAQLKGYTTQESEQQSTEQAKQTADTIATELPDVVTGIAQQFGISDQRALGAAYQQISKNIGAYYRYATPLDAQNYGVTEGEIIRDDDAVADTIQRFATLLQQNTKVEAVKANNKAALGAGKTAPKTVSAKGSPGAAEKPKTFKTKEEYLTHMGLNS